MGAVNAVILCPGESLSPALPALRDGRIAAPSFIIGVNRAVQAYPCDYWCSMDAQPYREIEPQGKPKYIIRHDQLRKLEDHELPNLERAAVIKKRMEGYPSGVDYSFFSILAAIAFAAANGATEIDVYGSDWNGCRDWDDRAHPKPHRRNEKRWIKEKKLYNELTDYYAKKGVTVKRRWIQRDPIHFVWFNPPLPIWAKRNINEFVRLNPDRQIYIHGEEVLLEEYEDIYADIKDKDKSGKGNLLRLSALQRYGGWYFDVDFWPFRPLKEAEKKFDLTGEKLLCAYENTTKRFVNNGFLHIAQESPAWDEINKAVHAVERPFKRKVFGPFILTDMAKRNSDNLHLLGHEWFYPTWVKIATEQYNKIVRGEDPSYLAEYNKETEGEMPFAMHLWANKFGGGLI